MEYPWKVVGWEKTVSDSGTEGCRLYVEQQLQAGADGEGVAFIAEGKACTVGGQLAAEGQKDFACLILRLKMAL